MNGRMHHRALLEGAFDAAVAACKRPEAVIDALPERPKGRVVIIAAGKGAVPMAQAVEAHWPDVTGLAITRTGYGGPFKSIELIEAGHPVPDEAGAQAAERCLVLADGLGEDDLLLVLLSGGASALLAAPQPPLTLEAKQALTVSLLKSGASVSEINCVRRHLSRIKGGRLAATAFPAQTVTLAISDVVGDPPADIGSGPTVGDPTTIADAQAILARYNIADPGGWNESVKSDDPNLSRSSFHVVVRPADALAAAARFLEDNHYEPRIFEAEATGEAREVAQRHALAAMRAHEEGKALALISGGELTVTVEGSGTGGPNQEYALAFAGAIEGQPDFALLAADTDGVDGNCDVAGAYVDGDTVNDLGDASIDIVEALADNDAGGALGEVGGLFVPGPTQTNVNDLRIILVDARMTAERIPERIIVHTDLLEIAVDVWGPEDGDAVLLLHGFPYDPRSFDKAAPLLAAQGLRCYAPYLRGFGPTRFLRDDMMRSGQQTAIADDARALLDALGIERALVAGFDWGGRAACICAALWPERFVGMLTVGGYLVQDLADPTKLMPAAIEHLVWHQYFIASARGRRALAERPQDICLHLRRQWSPGLVDEALFAETAKSFANPDFAEVSWHSYAHRIGAAAGDPFYAALDAALIPPPPVPVPAVVLTGDKARLAGGLGDRFPKLVAHCVAPGAGHDPAAETPDAFAEAVMTLHKAVRR